MNIIELETIDKGNGHFIEFGFASWDNKVEVIRRRKNNDNGVYDPISSSIIPINSGFIDIAELFCECIKKDKISILEMEDIQEEIKKSIGRKGQ